jgi:hypothetical protein
LTLKIGVVHDQIISCAQDWAQRGWGLPRDGLAAGALGWPGGGARAHAGVCCLPWHQATGRPLTQLARPRRHERAGSCEPVLKLSRSFLAASRKHHVTHKRRCTRWAKSHPAPVQGGRLMRPLTKTRGPSRAVTQLGRPLTPRHRPCPLNRRHRPYPLTPRHRPYPLTPRHRPYPLSRRHKPHPLTRRQRPYPPTLSPKSNGTVPEFPSRCPPTRLA